MSEADTICAIATGPAEGAIGIVRLSGPRALPLLKDICGGGAFPPRRLRLVRIRHPRSGEIFDQALACFLPGPRSYSGEDMAELQVHGGLLNLRRILELLLELGARLAAPGEFTRRAFLNGRLDLSQAEAVAEVIGARSERALRNAQALLAGGLRDRLRPIRTNLLELGALLEASIDFSEELGEPATRGDLLERARRAALELERLAGTYPSGRRLQGARVGLVGPVNAGKSTLFNRLLGAERALVSEQPGTTRDYLEAELLWEGQRLQLVDGAGWRAEAEQSPLERAGSALLRSALLGCDLLLEVIDLTAGPLEGLVGWPELEGLPRLRVGNKLDLLDAEQRQRLSADGLLLISARSGDGIPALRARLFELLFAAGTEESLLISQERHWRALLEARAALASTERAIEAALAPELVAEHLRDALEALGTITGESFSEALLDEVFARFCLGK